MIIVRLIGGLGNQMFQYAIGRHLALKNNTRLKLDIQGFRKDPLRKYSLECFNIQAGLAGSNDLSDTICPHDGFLRKGIKYLRGNLPGIKKLQYVREERISYIPEILTLRDNTYLDGYWQSGKYFQDITKILKKDFTFRSEPDPVNRSFMKNITSSESVGIHIRRGDYVSNPDTNKVHGLLDPDYYQKAISYMLDELDEPRLFIFSDEPAWVENHFRPDAPAHVIKHNAGKDHEDMRLLSACRHHVIANSSFSWWGTWLSSHGNKIVIAPKKWYREDKFNMNDIHAENWVTI